MTFTSKEDIEFHITELKKRNKDRLRTKKCFFNTFGTDAQELELHHLLGKYVPELVIPLDKHCHDLITEDQQTLSPQTRKYENEGEDKYRFLLASTAGFLAILAEHHNYVGNVLTLLSHHLKKQIYRGKENDNNSSQSVHQKEGR